MIEQEHSELLSRLLRLTSEEDAVSGLNDVIGEVEAFPQPWGLLQSEVEKALAKLTALEREQPALEQWISSVRACYENSQQRLLKGAEKREPRVSCFIPGRGWHYLSEAPDAETGKRISQSVTENTLVSTGTSKITFCGGIHFKFCPKKPGIEYAIHALDALLFPKAVTNPSFFIKLRLPDGRIEEVLATQTVYGKTVDKACSVGEEINLQFSAAHFTQHLLLQLLTAPGDGKLDNFMLSQGLLIGIDNEMAFEPEIVLRVGNKEHVSHVHTFLFFLPQMQQSLDGETISRFKTLSLEKYFLLWLKELETRNALYDRLERPHLKAVFDEGALQRVYERLKAIQQFFRERSFEDITGHTLLKAVMPEVYAYYQALDTHLSKMPIAEKVKALQKSKRGDEDALTFERLDLAIFSPSSVIKEEDLKATEIHRRNGQASRAPIAEQTPQAGIAALTQWSHAFLLSTEEKEAFLTELRMGALPLERLILKGSDITGEKLLSLMKGACLSFLSLEQTQVTFEELKRVMSLPGCASLEVCLGENAHLGLSAWQFMLHSPLCHALTLLLPDGTLLKLKGKRGHAKHETDKKSEKEEIEVLDEANYLQSLSRQSTGNKKYLKTIETLLIQEGYPLKSFQACLLQQADPHAQLFMVSSIRYVILMLESRQSPPEKYLDCYIKLNKTWREVFYQYALQGHHETSRAVKIQELLGEYPDPDGERRLTSVREQQFRSQLVSLLSPVLSKEGIQIEGLTIGKAYLHLTLQETLMAQAWLISPHMPEVDPKEWGNFDFARKKQGIKKIKSLSMSENEIEKTNVIAMSSVQHGNHLVIPIEFKDARFHFKILPDFPGMEMAYSLLNQRLMGKGSPQAELWKWTYGQYCYPVLISETLMGENLTPALLKEYPLELFSYQQQVLMAMLVNPGDGNPGNFLAQKVKAADGSVQLRLVSIDNDRLFALPFENGKLRTATLIYCFNEMQTPVHKDLRALFLSLDAYQLLSGWLSALETLNQHYHLLQRDLSLEPQHSLQALIDKTPTLESPEQTNLPALRWGT